VSEVKVAQRAERSRIDPDPMQRLASGLVAAENSMAPSAPIPEFEYFRGPNWHADQRDLFIAWTPDSGHALAIFDGRFGSNSIVWIDSSSHKVTTVLKSLESAFDRVLEKKEGAPSRKNPESYASRFSNPAFTSPPTFTVYAEAAVPKAWTTRLQLRSPVGAPPAKKRFVYPAFIH
jgi:hypothetical protein